jgi:hypothetical protein
MNWFSWLRVFSWESIIDLITVIPFLFALGLPNGQYWSIPNYLRAFNAVHRLRKLLLLNVSGRWWASLPHSSQLHVPVPLDSGLDPLTVKLVDLSASLLAFLFVSMSAFQFTELAFADVYHNVVQSCYFVIITIATVSLIKRKLSASHLQIWLFQVGYGDIVPSSDASRVLVMVMLLGALAYFPFLINGIVETYHIRRGDCEICLKPCILI